LTAEGIDQLAIGCFGHGIDGQVAAGEIFFQRDLGRRVEGEAVVAVAGLALGTGQRVFLVRFGMQEDREILADRAIIPRLHGLRA
jgi:hypothetical protein